MDVSMRKFQLTMEIAFASHFCVTRFFDFRNSPIEITPFFPNDAIAAVKLGN